MSRPWMPLYVADYIADTRRLTTIEHGAYLLLIMEYWRKHCLPRDEALLQAIVGMSDDQWMASRDVIRSFFTIQRGAWNHKRVDKELQDADFKYEKRAAAGRKGGLKRLSNATSNATSNASSDDLAMLNQPQPQHTKEDSKEKIRKKEKPQNPKKSVVEVLKTVLNEKTAQDVIDHRKAKRAPLTPRAAELLVAAFRDHGEPELAAEAMIVNGWQGFKPEWITNRERIGSNGHQRPITAFNRPSMREHILDADRKVRAAEKRLSELKSQPRITENGE